jgi:hypothetical protein
MMNSWTMMGLWMIGLGACTANVPGPDPQGSPDASTFDASNQDAPFVSADAGAPLPIGPPSTPCVQPPADDAAIGDDCFAYELNWQCAAYECGRTVHYFCNSPTTPQQPFADCILDGTTFRADGKGYCCTEAACVAFKSADALCNAEGLPAHARSCPTVYKGDAGAGCTRLNPPDAGSRSTPWERGDPIYCCP